jgi:hypothetical protein
MKTGIRIHQDRKRASSNGSALVTVMILSAILVMASVGLHKMSGQLIFNVSNFSRSAQALSIAEAGVADVLEKQSRNFDAYKNWVVSEDFGGGSYAVVSVTNGRTGSIITSTGTFGGRTKVTVVEVLGTWQDSWNTNVFGSFGIFCDGLSDNNGNGTLHASIFSGTSVDVAPGVTIDGSVSTEGTINNQGTVGGESEENAESIPCPTFSFEYFKALADGDYLDAASGPGGKITFKGNNSGTYFFVGSGLPSSDTFDPNDGDVSHPDPDHDIICVLGDVVIQNGAYIRGSIIATGDINMQGGHVDHAATPGPNGETPMPSLMSINGDVTICSGQTLNGFVYAGGDVVLNGGDVVYGGVIAGGTVDARGDWEIFPGPGIVPPGVNPGGEGLVSGLWIGGWLK